jgi:ribosome biogenesis protein BMS1
LLLIDAKFGFEMETFEFLNIAQVYGLPRVMGVLTHMDLYKKMNKQLNKRKTQLKHRFWTEIYQVIISLSYFYINFIPGCEIISYVRNEKW